VCNLMLTSSGKLVQIKPMAASAAPTFENDGLPVAVRAGADRLVGEHQRPIQPRLDLFREMHHSVLDYTGLLSCDCKRSTCYRYPFCLYSAQLPRIQRLLARGPHVMRTSMPMKHSTAGHDANTTQPPLPSRSL
jgi:hypothetical protein